jgi:hypothetical protein
VLIVNQQGNDNRKTNHENSHHTIFLLEERHRTFGNRTVNSPQPGALLAVQTQINRNGRHFLHIKKGNAQSKQRQQYYY